jgi:hypothetical protein
MKTLFVNLGVGRRPHDRRVHWPGLVASVAHLTSSRARAAATTPKPNAPTAISTESNSN